MLLCVKYLSFFFSDVHTQIQPLSHQEIVPFSFKKGLSLLRDRDRDLLKDGNTFSRGGDIELSNLSSKNCANSNERSNFHKQLTPGKLTFKSRAPGVLNGHVGKSNITQDVMGLDEGGMNAKDCVV